MVYGLMKEQRHCCMSAIRGKNTKTEWWCVSFYLKYDFNIG